MYIFSFQSTEEQGVMHESKTLNSHNIFLGFEKLKTKTGSRFCLTVLKQCSTISLKACFIIWIYVSAVAGPDDHRRCLPPQIHNFMVNNILT